MTSMKDLTHITLQKPPEFLFCAVEGDSVDDAFKCGLNRLKMPFIVAYESDYDAKREIPLEKSPASFVILSGLMAEDGYRFMLAETGEWLTDEVPAKYLRFS